METSESGQHRRRHFITAGAAAIGAATILSSHEAKAGTFSAANIRDYYAGGDWDSAFSSALSTGMPIYFPASANPYSFAQEIHVVNRDLVMYGDGPDVSKLLFRNATNGINFNGQHYQEAVDQLIVRNLGLIAGNAGCANAVFGYWTWASSLAQAASLPAAIIQDVTVSTNDSASRFVTGICLMGGDNSRILNCHFSQLNFSAGVRDAYGVVLDNVSPNMAPETQIVGCEFANQSVGVWIRSWCEGIKITDCSFVGNIIGILADGTNLSYGLGLLFVSGCHFDTYSMGIDARSVFNLHVHGNNFIAENGSNTNPAYCISMTRTRAAMPYAEDSLITNNTFRRNDITATTIYAIRIAGFNSSSKASGVLIDANRYSGQVGAVFNAIAVLDANSTRNRYTDTNLTDTVTPSLVLDSGTGNVIDTPRP